MCNRELYQSNIKEDEEVKEELSEKQQKIAIHHSTTNIIRAIVLMKRADNTLSFAISSLEGTDMIDMVKDIEKSILSITEAIGKLEKYIY